MSSEQVKVRLAPHVARKLRALAARAGLTVSDWIARKVERAPEPGRTPAQLDKLAELGREASGKRYE